VLDSAVEKIKNPRQQESSIAPEQEQQVLEVKKSEGTRLRKDKVVTLDGGSQNNNKFRD